MLKNVKAFTIDESGASAVEYALLVAGVGTAVAAGVGSFDFGNLFSSLIPEVGNGNPNKINLDYGS